jgi:transposase
MGKVTDAQVKELRRELRGGASLKKAALKANMDRKSARKYREGKMPKERRQERTWRTRVDPLATVWPELQRELERAPELQANTLLALLQERYPGQYGNEVLRTMQRRVKCWRALAGRDKEVFFAQVHEPGRLGASDFTHLTSLGVTIADQAFPHLAYHFVLTYSNWEHVTLCFSESFASLSEGLQNALWALGGVPRWHRTDCMTLAVNQDGNPERFTKNYQGLMDHYGLQAQATNPHSGHENGDCEQAHRQFKRALEQALLVRGSRDFATREEYTAFVHGVVARQNALRQQRLAEELRVLQPLPARRLETLQRLAVKVTSGSTIRVLKNTYSVPARLIGEWVEAWVGAEHIDVRYAQQRVLVLPRLRGQDKHCIDYRHIIGWLVKKPGAFAGYCYQSALFPTSRFRQAYDELLLQQPARASREYVRILHLAARRSESGVDEALGRLLAAGQTPSAAEVETMLVGDERRSLAAAVRIEAVNLASYDVLLPGREKKDAQGCFSGVDNLPAGTAPADDAGGVSNAGSASAAGVVELSELSAGVGRARMSAAAAQADGASVEGVASAVGQEPANLRPEAAADQGSAASTDVAHGGVRAASGERVAVWSARQRQDTLLLRSGPGTGSCRPAGAVHEVQQPGADAAAGQARADAEIRAAASDELGRVDHRRSGLRAAEPGGDGGAVHLAGGALRAGQCHGDEQPGVLAMGADLQGPDDDGGGHRSAGASLHDRGAERSQLPHGDGQKGTPGPELKRQVDSPGRVGVRPPWGAGEAPLASAALRLAPLPRPPKAECFDSITVGICNCR